MIHDSKQLKWVLGFSFFAVTALISVPASAQTKSQNLQPSPTIYWITGPSIQTAKGFKAFKIKAGFPTRVDYMVEVYKNGANTDRFTIRADSPITYERGFSTKKMDLSMPGKYKIMFRVRNGNDIVSQKTVATYDLDVLESGNYPDNLNLGKPPRITSGTCPTEAFIGESITCSVGVYDPNANSYQVTFTGINYSKIHGSTDAYTVKPFLVEANKGAVLAKPAITFKKAGKFLMFVTADEQYTNNTEEDNGIFSKTKGFYVTVKSRETTSQNNVSDQDGKNEQIAGIQDKLHLLQAQVYSLFDIFFNQVMDSTDMEE